MLENSAAKDKWFRSVPSIYKIYWFLVGFLQLTTNSQKDGDNFLNEAHNLKYLWEKRSSLQEAIQYQLMSFLTLS